MNSRNIFAKEWRARYERLPEETKKKIDYLNECSPSEYQLQVIKRKRAYPQVGDVFMLKTKEGITFRGIVVNNHVRHSSVDECLIIMIFKANVVVDEVVKRKITREDLLLTPLACTDLYWKKGYFFTEYNIPDIKIDNYGFYDYITDRYEDEYGNEMEEPAEILCSRGIYTEIGIAIDIYKELIISGEIQFLKEVNTSENATYTEVKRGKKKKYVKINREEDDISVTFDVTDEKIIEIGEKMNELCEEAYMNGYNWEAFLNYYLEMKNPEILEVIETDSEAEMYCAIIEDAGPSEKKIAKKLGALIEDLFHHEETIYSFLKENLEDIEWE